MIRDQADNLRQVIKNIKSDQKTSNSDINNSIPKKPAKVITVTSGKGGVGKSNITINLALALSDLGHKVTILDADFGLANVDVLMGIIPEYTLLDVIECKKNILEVLTNGPKNIKFVSGGSGIESLVKLDKSQLDKFLDSISLLDKICDIILIDTGAGLSDSVMNFVMAADEVLLVTTPDPSSIMDAYALIKMVSKRDKSKNIKVIINKAENIKEANEISNKLSLVSERFLSLKLYYLGYILHDEFVMKAVKLQQPFLLNYPKSQAARQIREISKELTADMGPTIIDFNTGIKGFINKLVNLISS